MKTPIKNGGSAFPVPPDDLIASKPGMTLRDYFAGQALELMSRWNGGLHHGSFEAIARDCYQTADAMLKEREK